MTSAARPGLLSSRLPDCPSARLPVFSLMDIRQSGTAVRFSVLVQPRASRTEIVGEHGDALKLRVAAPPVEGAANEVLLRFLAKQLGVPASAVRVAGGASGRRKLIEIEGVSVEVVRAALLGTS